MYTKLNQIREGCVTPSSHFLMEPTPPSPLPSKWEGANKSNRPTPGGGCYRSLTRGYPLLAPNGAAKCRASRGQNELGRGVKNTPARGHLLLWQGKRDVFVAALGPRFAAAASDDDVLPSVEHVGGGGGVAAGWEFCLPEDLAGFLVKCVNHFIVGRGDKNQAAGGEHGTT